VGSRFAVFVNESIPTRPRGVLVARALLLEQGHAAEVAQDVRDALEGACLRLHQRLDPWIGADGCTRVFHRALLITAESHPALANAGAQSEAPHIVGLAGLASQPLETAQAAAEALLAFIVQHLGRMVGDDVAVRLLLPEARHLWTVGSRAGGDAS